MHKGKQMIIKSLIKPQKELKTSISFYLRKSFTTKIGLHSIL